MHCCALRSPGCLWWYPPTLACRYGIRRWPRGQALRHKCLEEYARQLEQLRLPVDTASALPRLGALSPLAPWTPLRCPNHARPHRCTVLHTHVPVRARAHTHTSLTLTSPHKRVHACVRSNARTHARTHARTQPFPNICISGGMVSHTGTVSRAARYPMRDACTPNGAGLQTLRSFMRSPWCAE